jgi:uncharacterized membrane-anchored protein YhcB (DUF1043 family)
MELFQIFETLVLIVVSIELATEIYHIGRMENYDRKIDTHIAKMDEHLDRMDHHISELDKHMAKLDELLERK